MQIYLYSDSSYLSEPESKINVGGFFYLFQNMGNVENTSSEIPETNESFHNECSIKENVIES